MSKVYIMVGPSGSCKSTIAKELSKVSGAIICSADHYFYDSLGNYNFNVKKLGHAHKMCYDKAKRYLSDGKDVIIDNTNLVAKDRKQYEKLAVDFGAEVVIITPQTEWRADVDKLVEKNTKGTPREVLERHVKEYKKFLNVNDC